jgi:hypothetical protein
MSLFSILKHSALPKNAQIVHHELRAFLGHVFAGPGIHPVLEQEEFLAKMVRAMAFGCLVFLSGGVRNPNGI